tara:strand:- start:358 stop:645 length:288 start_codon:yes stop_codon:yes gene_type:complete
MPRATGAVTLEVRVTPRSKRNSVEVASLGHLRVRVTVAPEGGKANAAVLKLLAKSLGIPKSRMTIIRGQTNRDKVISIDGVTSSSLEVKLGELSD